MFERQDGRDSAQGYEAHGLIVGNEPEDQWPGWPPGVRHPLNTSKIPSGPATR